MRTRDCSLHSASGFSNSLVARPSYASSGSQIQAHQCSSCWRRRRCRSTSALRKAADGTARSRIQSPSQVTRWLTVGLALSIQRRSERFWKAMPPRPTRHSTRPSRGSICFGFCQMRRRLEGGKTSHHRSFRSRQHMLAHSASLHACWRLPLLHLLRRCVS